MHKWNEGLGGGIKNGTFVWTPAGLRLIEMLQPGDLVIGGNGLPCLVESVSRHYPQRLLSLTLDRGEQVECVPDQQWLVLHPAARFPTRHSHGKVEINPRFNKWEVLSAQAMLTVSGSAPLPRRRFLLPSCERIQMDAQDTPMSPYLLGLLLGDGCMRNGGTSISTGDAEIIEATRALLPTGVVMNQATKYDHVLVVPGGRGHGVGGGRAGNPLTNILKALGIHGLLSMDKFVPQIYLNNSDEVRLAVLQGLMDTDGTVTATHGMMEFSSTSLHLIEAVEFLVASFGGKSVTTRRITRFTDKFGERRDGMPSYRTRIRLPQVTPFRLQRKISRLVRPLSTCDERVIHSIEETSGHPCTAISTHSPDGTFVLKKGIVVHGSAPTL